MLKAEEKIDDAGVDMDVDMRTRVTGATSSSTVTTARATSTGNQPQRAVGGARDIAGGEASDDVREVESDEDADDEFGADS